MTVLAWHNANAANGPKVVRWLEERGAPTIGRPIREWRNGTQATIPALDKVLVDRGFHLSDLPDDVWELRRKRPRRPDPAVTVRVLAAYAEIGTKRGAAETAGVPVSTARDIIDRDRQAA